MREKKMHIHSAENHNVTHFADKKCFHGIIKKNNIQINAIYEEYINQETE